MPGYSVRVSMQEFMPRMLREEFAYAGCAYCCIGDGFSFWCPQSGWYEMLATNGGGLGCSYTPGSSRQSRCRRGAFTVVAVEVPVERYRPIIMTPRLVHRPAFQLKPQARSNHAADPLPYEL